MKFISNTIKLDAIKGYDRWFYFYKNIKANEMIGRLDTYQHLSKETVEGTFVITVLGVIKIDKNSFRIMLL